MHESIHAFTLPFGHGDQTFSTDEDLERRKAVRREIKAMMPMADKLPNSRLVDRIGVVNNKYVLHFWLEFTGQLALPLGLHRSEAVKTILERDLLALRESAKSQQRTIFLAAQHSDQFKSILASNKATKSDIALRALMRRYQGTSLSLDFADSPMIFRFPEHPAFRCDGETRVISARIKKITPISVHLETIKYEDSDHDEIKKLGKIKQRIALLPPDPERKLQGMRCARAMFDHRKIKLRVKTALDYLSERISHYEIQVGA